MHDQLGLFTRRQLTEVPQKLEEPEIPGQVRFADATKHVQIRLEQREQALGPILMHVAPRIFLLRMVDEVVGRALERLLEEFLCGLCGILHHVVRLASRLQHN